MSKIVAGVAGVIAGSIMALWRSGMGAGKFLLSVAQRLRFVRTVTIPGKGRQVRFATPNRMTHWRIETYFDKEPETLEWLGTMKEGDVLFDIGGNIGLYSIYAAALGKVSKVIAFEPESANYALLNANIVLNGFDEKVTALNMALSDSKGMDYLHLASEEAGSAMHSFGTSGNARSVHKQGAISYSLDQFIEEFSPPFPTHIKVDVDGLEKKIIDGAKKTLADRRLKTLQVEIDEGLAGDMDIVRAIEAAGFAMLHKKHAPMFDNGPYAKVFNYGFARPEGA